jgi:hypothetical protein
MLRTRSLALCVVVICLCLASSAFALNHGTYLYHNGQYTAYSTAQAAFDASVPGDAVVYGPGLYGKEGFVKTSKSGTASLPITIRGDGTPKPIVSPEGVKKNLLPLSHAPICIQHDYIVVENLEIKNCSASYGFYQNSSGLYTYNADYTTVRDVYIHDCGHGIYASDNCTNLIIENSELCYNGYPTDQFYHNAYINGGPNIVRYNTWHHCKAGLGYKDRSLVNLDFLYNTVFRNGNYELDMMQGTGVQNATVMGNVILKPGAGTNNDYQIIYFGTRGGGTLTFVNNYVRAGSANNTFLHIGAAESAIVNNNTFDNNGVAAVDIFFESEGLSLTGTNNWGATDSINRGSLVNWVLGTAPGVIDNSNGNFHLTSGSQCINSGSSSVSPLPDKEAVYPTSYVTRSISGNIDIGPYEYSASTGVAPLPSYGLTATPLSATSVRLNWSNDSNLATGYRIERYNNATVGFITAGAAGAGATTWTDTGCTTKTKYVYRVIAYSASGDGGHSNEVVITTP